MFVLVSRRLTLQTRVTQQPKLNRHERASRESYDGKDDDGMKNSLYTHMSIYEQPQEERDDEMKLS